MQAGYSNPFKVFAWLKRVMFTSVPGNFSRDVAKFANYKPEPSIDQILVDPGNETLYF
jgi:hypothetical protein